MQAWVEKGEPVQPFTTLKVAYDRTTGQKPFSMPPRWIEAKSALDLNTRFNLSTNNDIVGGNSGSPLVNAKGELVGLMFDGNIHSLGGEYGFDESKNRAVAVHSAAIVESLRVIYGAQRIADELRAGKP